MKKCFQCLNLAMYNKAHELFKDAQTDEDARKASC